MKKLLIIALAAGVAGIASADYGGWIGDATWGPKVGGLSDVNNWVGGVYSSGSTTGLIVQADNIWSDVLQDMAVRLEGGTISSGGDTALRGGSNGSGITTVFEIETTDYASTVNLNTASLTLWSQWGEKMELSILAGQVQVAGSMSLVSDGNGTINMGDGLLHAGSLGGSDATINMLAGGIGTVVIDDMNNNALSSINFGTGNLGSITYGENAGGTAGGQWEWAVTHGWVSIGGVVDTDLASYSITTAGGNDSTLSVIPEPATLGMVALVGGGMVWIRKRFMI